MYYCTNRTVLIRAMDFTTVYQQMENRYHAAGVPIPPIEIMQAFVNHTIVEGIKSKTANIDLLGGMINVILGMVIIVSKPINSSTATNTCIHIGAGAMVIAGVLRIYDVTTRW